MTARQLRERLLQSGTTARYGLFFNLGLVLALAGGGLFIWALTGAQADRAWHLFHVNWLFFTSLTGGSIAVVAVDKLANAKWTGVILRFSEATICFAVVSILGLVAIMTVGYEPIFGHMREQLHALSPGKALWLSHGFMFGRLLVGLLVLFGLGWALVRADMLPDLHLAKDAVSDARRRLYERTARGFDGSDAARTAQHAKINRLAAVYIVVYAFVFTLVAFDTIMALQPHWYSNLLGGFFFMGAFLAGYMLLAPLLLFGRRHLGIPDLVSPKQRHDLGKLCFGFTVFWAYLMWAQFLVIWYGNMPEETGFVFARLWGPWMPIGRDVLLGMFIIPFSGLLFVASKKTPVTFALFTGLSLVSFWLERYLLVMPSVTLEPGPVFGLAEAGPTALLLGLFLLCYALFARRYPMVSPRLAEITLGREAAHDGHEFEHDEAPGDFAHPKELEGGQPA